MPVWEPQERGTEFYCFNIFVSIFSMWDSVIEIRIGSLLSRFVVREKVSDNAGLWTPRL
jgi:hypothetical protein